LLVWLKVNNADISGATGQALFPEAGLNAVN